MPKKELIKIIKTAEKMNVGDLIETVLKHDSSSKLLDIIKPENSFEENINNLLLFVIENLQDKIEIVNLNNDIKSIYLVYKKKEKKKKVESSFSDELVSYLKNIRKFRKCEINDLTEEDDWKRLIQEKIEILKDEILEVIYINDILELEKINKVGNSFQLVIFFDDITKEEMLDRINFVKSLLPDKMHTILIDSIKYQLELTEKESEK